MYDNGTVPSYNAMVPSYMVGTIDGSTIYHSCSTIYHVPLHSMEPYHCTVRNRIIARCGTTPLQGAEPHHCTVWNHTIARCGTTPLHGAEPHHCKVRNHTIAQCGTTPLHGAATRAASSTNLVVCSPRVDVPTPTQHVIYWHQQALLALQTPSWPSSWQQQQRAWHKSGGRGVNAKECKNSEHLLSLL